jgi:hypothetical protein
MADDAVQKIPFIFHGVYQFFHVAQHKQLKIKEAGF